MAEPAPTSDIFDLHRFPIHLGLGATAVAQPEHTGDVSWYEGYGERHESDGFEGRLVAMHTFESSWDTWEMHPNGSELVIITAGTVNVIQEIDGAELVTTTRVGEVAINRPGVWHTMDIDAPATAVFITAGVGTEMRAR